jgi:hypothetical protein
VWCQDVCGSELYSESEREVEFRNFNCNFNFCQVASTPALSAKQKKSMKVVDWLVSLPTELVGTLVIAKLEPHDLVRLNIALLVKDQRSDIQAWYKAAGPITSPVRWSSESIRLLLQWLFQNNLTVDDICVEDQFPLLPLIADNIQFTSVIRLKVRSYASWLQLQEFVYSPSLLHKIVGVYICVNDFDPDEEPDLVQLPFCHLRTISWHSQLLLNEILPLLVLENSALATLRVECSLPLPDGLVDALYARRDTLRTLELSTGELTDADLLTIASTCTLLTKFCLTIRHGTEVTDGGVCAVIRGCPLLECLSVRDPKGRLTSASLATALQCVVHLSRLRMIDTVLRNDAVVVQAPQQLHICWGVTSLDTVFPNRQVLAAIVDLEIWGIRYGCMVALLTAMRGMTQLRHFGLYCADCTVPRAVVEALTHAGSGKLTNIHIHARSMDDAESALVELVRSNPGLVSFDVSTGVAAITDALVFELALCVNLRKVKIREAQSITDASVITLAQNCRLLTDIYMLSNALLTDDSALALADNCTALRCVNLNSCVLLTEPAVMRIFDSCDKLRQLTVAAGSISKRFVEVWREYNIAPKITRWNAEAVDADSDESADEAGEGLGDDAMVPVGEDNGSVYHEGTVYGVEGAEEGSYGASNSDYGGDSGEQGSDNDGEAADGSTGDEVSNPNDSAESDGGDGEEDDRDSNAEMGEHMDVEGGDEGERDADPELRELSEETMSE